MKDLLVIMPATQEYGLMRQYIGQLEAAKIDYHVARLSEIPNANAGGTHAYALDFYRRCAQLFGNYEKLVFSDAFDVLFFGTKDEVIWKIPSTHVLCAAERNCYPDPSLASLVRNTLPWRFVNCGLTAGTPESFLKWVEKIEVHPLYVPDGLNQAFFNTLLSRGEHLGELDDITSLFYCLYMDAGELDFDKGMPINKLCLTRPNFIHFNGKCFHPGVLARREETLR